MANETIDELHAYQRRLEKLEKQNRWMQAAVSVLAVLFLANVILTRPRRFAAVTASEFDLKDPNGATRARLAMSPDGPGLELYAPSGEERATLVGGDENAGLSLYIPATASPGAAAAVNLFNGTEQIASLSGSPSATSLQIDSATGNVTASLAANNDFALLGLKGTTENTESVPSTTSNASCANPADAEDHKSAPLGAMICLDSQAGPTIVLSRQGKSLWSAPTTALPGAMTGR